MEDCGFRPVVVAPTYNNVRTLGDILERTRALGLPMIVVNDGSTDGTDRLLAERAAPWLTAVAHAVNRGKAAALQTGFAAALAAQYTHAVSIDTDGQLDPEQIPALLDAARANPQALVVGCRDDQADDYPARSRAGRRVSNLLVRLESGVRVGDSQCGFRVYPLAFVAAVPCRVGHFGFETEVITRAGWAGCPIVQVPVRCKYLPAGQRVSHFRPCLDTLRGARMHLYLLGRTLCPLPRHPRWPAAAARRASTDLDSLPTRFWRWINPARAWRQLKESQIGRAEIAAGLAVGVFIANLPLYGVQSLLSLYTARRLHLHPLSVLLGSHISTPPVGPLMIAAAISLGHLVFHGTLPAVADFDPRRDGWAAIVGPRLLEWSVGGVLLGTVMSLLTFVFAMSVMRWFAQEEAATA